MANEQTVLRVRAPEAVLATNKVIRNTYALLSMTLLFSAVAAMAAVVLQASPGAALVSTVAGIGLVWFVLPRFRNSVHGLWLTFLFTGLMGYGLGPMLMYHLAMANGPQTVATALAGTGVIFLGLSGYALTSRRDFSFLGGFVFVGLLVVIAAALANLFLHIPALSLAISAAAIMLFSAFILYDTSRLIHGGETNYIMATVALYLDILNIFVHLLNILGVMGGDD